MIPKKEIVSAKEAATLPGVPYSAGVKMGNLFYTAGQLPNDPQADMKTQTRQVLTKVKALVEAAGSSMDDVVKCTVFITNFDEFQSMNEAYKEFFKDKPPARTTVGISKLASNARIEIEAVALVP